MGDISVIARRLSDKHVQHGWSGNGGYLRVVGARLWNEYNTPEMVEYLFSLGQLRELGAPGSEKSKDNNPWAYKTTPKGEPHWVATTELDMFRKICFVDHAYMYDSDETWYYFVDGMLKIKLPLETALYNMAEHGDISHEFRLHLERTTFDTIQREWYESDTPFREYAINLGYDEQRMAALGQELSQVEDSLFDYESRDLLDSLKMLYQFFEYWAVGIPDETRKTISGVILMPKSDQHIETIHWTEGNHE